MCQSSGRRLDVQCLAHYPNSFRQDMPTQYCRRGVNRVPGHWASCCEYGFSAEQAEESRAITDFFMTSCIFFMFYNVK